MKSIQRFYKPLVSVVLATYNGEKYLTQQLDSIIQQDYPNIEIIVTDDCSTDNTFKILQDYAAKHPFIQILRNENNIGLNKNFEKGLLLANGEYIAISDQDDIWKPNKLTRLVSVLNSHSIVYHNSELINSYGVSLKQKLSDKRQLSDFTNCLNFAVVATVPGHAMLFRKSLVEQCIPFPENVILYDHWLAFVATFTSDIKFIPEPLVLYRQHDNNMFGTGAVKTIKKNKNKSSKSELGRKRIELLYSKCPDELTTQKNILGDLLKSYESFSIKNNFNRMMIFFRNNEVLLASKKRNKIRKWLFCLKTFFKMP